VCQQRMRLERKCINQYLRKILKLMDKNKKIKKIVVKTGIN